MYFSTRIPTCSPSLVSRNWLLLYLAWKPNPLVRSFPQYSQSFLPHAACTFALVLTREYKSGSSPEPLALKAPLITWSVQWLLLQCAAALQRCMEQTLCWSQWHWYFSHFNLLYFPNIVGLIQRIVRFVMRTEPKASYRTVQYEYAYRYTPSIYIIYFHNNNNTFVHLHSALLGAQSAFIEGECIYYINIILFFSNIHMHELVLYIHNKYT